MTQAQLKDDPEVTAEETEAPADVTAVETKKEQDPKVTKQASQILDVANMLLEVLDRENVALREHDDDTIVKLVDRKDNITRLYVEHMNAVAQNPDMFSGLDEEQRGALESVANKLKVATNDNARLLQAEMEASNRFLKSVVEAVKNSKAETATYASNGAMKDGRPTGQENALTFNKEL